MFYINYISITLGEKRCPISYVSRELQIKTTRYHYRPIKWPKSKTMTILNAGEDEQQELSLLMGMQNGIATLEGSLAGSYETKNTPTIRSSNCVLCYQPKGGENLCAHKSIHVDVDSSFVHKCQTWKQPRCSLGSKWINCDASTQWSDIHHGKEMSYQTMKGHGANLNAYY